MVSETLGATVTFVRTRPAESINELWASTRRREGTTTLEVAPVSATDRPGAIAGGLLPISVGIGETAPSAWIVEPEDALELLKRDVAGWRITVADNGEHEAVLDAVARSHAAYLRVGRSRVAEGVAICGLPAIDTIVSVFVDTVHDAVAAVEQGAGDLLLRDWATEDLGALRDALTPRDLVERAAYPVEVTVDEAREELDKELFAAHLHLVDSSGTARPRYEWAPGMDMPAPVPEGAGFGPVAG